LRGRRAGGLGSRLANMTAAVTTGRPNPPATRELGRAEPRGRRAQRSIGHCHPYPRFSLAPDRSLSRQGCHGKPSSAAMHNRDSRCPVAGHCKYRRREDREPRYHALARVPSRELQALTRALHQIQPRPVREGHIRRGVPVSGCQLTQLSMSDEED